MQVMVSISLKQFFVSSSPNGWGLSFLWCLTVLEGGVLIQTPGEGSQISHRTEFQVNRRVQSEVVVSSKLLCYRVGRPQKLSRGMHRLCDKSFLYRGLVYVKTKLSCNNVRVGWWYDKSYYFIDLKRTIFDILLCEYIKA